MNWSKRSREFMMYSFMLPIACLIGCSSASFIKSDVKGPYKHDDLTNGSSIGTVKHGSFTEEGWKPGTDGSIMYELPGIAQGTIELVVTGLNRSDAESIFLTMYERGDLNYADPYVILNPFRVTLSLNNFNETPQSPFDFLWTIKEFPAGTDPEDRYVAGLPLGGGGYEKNIMADYTPVFPDAENTITIDWKYGKAQLFFNGKKIAEHDYRPLIYDPQAIILVVGKTPGAETFGLEHLVIHSVTVSLPGI